jgi:hemoglobin/transferrin/lactoferrin receptor protein
MYRVGSAVSSATLAGVSIVTLLIVTSLGDITIARAQQGQSQQTQGQGQLPTINVNAPKAKPAAKRKTPPAVVQRSTKQPPTAPSATTAQKEHDPTAPLGAQLPTPQTPHQVSQNVTVITRAQIEQTNPVGMVDLLGEVPGVGVSRNSGLGGQIFLRGCNSNNWRVPLYVDGDFFNGRNTLQLNYFNPDEIDRVEVIHGAASLMYGSNAMCGVVDFITRQPTGGPSYGPFQWTGGGYSLGGGTAAKSLDGYSWIQGAGYGFDVRADVGGRTGSDYQTPSGPAPNSDYKALNGSLVVGFSPTPNQRIELTLRDYSEVDGRAGGIGGAPGYPYLQVRQDPDTVSMARLAYTGDYVNGPFSHIESSIYANYFDTHLLTINTGSTTKIIDSNSHVIGPLFFGARASGVIPWGGIGDPIKTTVGFSSFYDTLPGSVLSSQTTTLNAAGAVISTTSSGATQQVPDASQTNVGAFMLHEWTPVQAFTLSLGARYDWFNTQTDLAPLLSPKLLPAYEQANNVDRTAPTESLGAVVRVLPMLDLIGSVGTSFRQPYVTELFSSTTTMIPNPSLQPETGITYEGGFNIHSQDMTLKVTAFDSNFKNFIQVVPVAYMGLSTYTQEQNVSTANIQGIEWEQRWQVTPSINIFGSGAIVRGTNTSTGTPLPYIAPVRGRDGVQYAPPDAGYSVEAVLNWATSKTRIDPTQEFPTMGYAIPSLYATVQLGKLVSPSLGDTRLTLGLENIFNRPYIDAATFANVAFPQSMTNPLLEEGRNYTAKLIHTF